MLHKPASESCLLLQRHAWPITAYPHAVACMQAVTGLRSLLWAMMYRALQQHIGHNVKSALEVQRPSQLEPHTPSVLKHAATRCAACFRNGSPRWWAKVATASCAPTDIANLDGRSRQTPDGRWGACWSAWRCSAPHPYPHAHVKSHS